MCQAVSGIAKALVGMLLVLAFSTSAPARALDHEAAAATDAIHSKIRQKLVSPLNVPPDATTVVEVDVKDDGYVTRVAVRKSCGHKGFDEAVMEAIIAAQPLPVPKNAAWRKGFRDMTFTFSAGR